MPSQQLLLIAGMHRSGTSALCAALEQCGASFGNNLLEAMSGVNEDGFWEDAGVVAVNEKLLLRLGGNWFAPPANLEAVDWSADSLSDLHEEAEAILHRGFGSGQLQAVKDPRLCLTLPFWLSLCHKLEVAVTVCQVSRAPLEVARSLHKRDAFPIGYGLRLYASYHRQLVTSLPADSLKLTYDSLLEDPLGVMRSLSETLPLKLPEAGLEGVVKAGLRHHEQQDDPVLGKADGWDDLDSLQTAIERSFPEVELASELVRGLVERGGHLTQLGQDHTAALATLEERDTDIENLSALHREALSTIEERDEQIADLDRRLTETGEHLGRALETLRARDARIEYFVSIPVLGVLIRVIERLHEKR